MPKNDAATAVLATPQDLGFALIREIRTVKNGSAANIGLPERCEKLLEQGADLNVRDENGMTPLMWSAANFRTKILRRLLDNGANVYVRDNNGMTALDHATKKKQKPAILMLQAAHMTQMYSDLEKMELKERTTIFKEPLRPKKRSMLPL